MATRNNLGKSIYFAAALPATNDAAGFEALTWLELEHPQTLPQFGITHANIDIPDLKDVFNYGSKGIPSGMDSQGSNRIDASEMTTNQLAFKAICESTGGQISIKIATGTGPGGALQTGDAVKYSHGYVHSYQENQATETSYEGFLYSFKQNAPAISAVNPTVT